MASRRYSDELLAAVLELLLSAPQSLLPAQVRTPGLWGLYLNSGEI